MALVPTQAEFARVLVSAYGSRKNWYVLSLFNLPVAIDVKLWGPFTVASTNVVWVYTEALFVPVPTQRNLYFVIEPE